MNLKHKQHSYRLTTKWTGNKGTGTSKVSAYDRTHTISITGKPVLELTTDNALYGNETMLNPEDLLVASLSSCHMMSYLYLCALEGVVIVAYTDEAAGTMVETANGGGHFTEVILHPTCTVTDASMIGKAIALHHKAHEICYIANSVNFPVRTDPVCSVAAE